jgi:predicted transposase/invertase (TIGR01784 family)
MRSNVRFLDPKTDVTFKKVFGTERNQDILVHFLNDMFAYWNEPAITQVTLLPSMQLAEHKDQSTSVVDIMCQDELNRRFIVELQVRPHRGFLERVQFYSARAYAAQNQERLIYDKLDPVITVVITDFDIFPHKAAYKSHHSTMDEETHEKDLKAQRYVVLNLAKFDKELDEIETIVDKWCYFFKYTAEISRKDFERLVGDDHIIERAYLEVAMYTWDQREIDRYDYEVDRRKVYEGQLESARDQGIEKGDLNARLDIARTMFQQGMPLETIAALTQVSIEDLKKHLHELT